MEDVALKNLTKPALVRTPKSKSSMSEFDSIDPEDIVYGEYSADSDTATSGYLDVVYLDGELLRTASGQVNRADRIMSELQILLRDDTMYYLVRIQELTTGFAFKRNTIAAIKTLSVMEGNEHRLPSCIWSVQFDEGVIRTIEIEYQAYFSYGKVTRPKSMTNALILESVFKALKSSN